MDDVNDQLPTDQQEELTDLAGDSMQFFSGQRVVVLGKISLKEVQPGKYTLEVTVLDKVSNRSVVASTDFKVNQPSTSVEGAPSAGIPRD